MSRLAFQREWAQGSTLNVGCGEDPAGFGDTALHLDLDRWRHPKSVQADAHSLPFRNETFDTVVIGDVLEHFMYPELAVQEAWRVIKPGGRLVLTVFKEWRIGPGPGQYIDTGARRYREELPPEFANVEEFKHHYPGYHGRCLQLVDESIMSHNPHINQFEEEHIRDIALHLPGGQVLHWELATEGFWQNWLIVLEKRCLL